MHAICSADLCPMDHDHHAYVSTLCRKNYFYCIKENQQSAVFMLTYHVMQMYAHVIGFGFSDQYVNMQIVCTVRAYRSG